MSIQRFIFLFDHVNFANRILSTCDNLGNLDFVQIRKLAINIVESNPKIWAIADYFGIFQEDNDFVEKGLDRDDDRIALWLVLIMANYCSIIENPVRVGAISKMIAQTGMDNKKISMLISGRPLGNMLSELVNGEVLTRNSFVENINNFPAGWISLHDIENIKYELQLSPRYKEISEFEELSTMLGKASKSNRSLVLGTAV